MNVHLFNMLFYAWTAKTVIVGNIIALLPGRAPLARYMRYWAQGVRVLMRWFAGITLEVRGHGFMPRGGAGLIAAKHQSYADGIMMAALIPGITMVATKDLLNYPLFGRVLRKLELMLVDACGDPKGQLRDMMVKAKSAARDGRPIVIYPEGRLLPVGEAGEYRSGIFHLYKELLLPVTPVATNIGAFWPQAQWHKRAGRAVIEFLEPIAPGLEREAFMAELQTRIESRSRALEAEAA